MLAIIAAAALAAAPQLDTVVTADGGRIVGTVIEETPRAVTIQLPDGTFRALPAAEVSRIEYSDGSVSAPARPAPPAEAAPGVVAAPPPPGPTAPQPAPAGNLAKLYPVYMRFGFGPAYVSGDAPPGVRMEDVFGPVQLNLWVEGGARLTPHLALGLYLDFGLGEASTALRDTCRSAGGTCSAEDDRIGLLLRYTFAPYAKRTPWIAAGTAWESGVVSVHRDPGSDDILSYDGWEMLRLMAGVDWRKAPELGFSLYAGVSLGAYSSQRDALGTVSIADPRVHTTLEVGFLCLLF